MHRILQLLAISLALGAVSPAPLSNPLAGFNSDTEVSGHDRSNCALLLPREKQFVDYSVPSGCSFNLLKTVNNSSHQTCLEVVQYG